MSIKDFSRGIAAQAHVDSLAWRKAAIAIEQLSDDDRKWRDKYGNIIDCTLDILSDREISEVYSVQKTFDIATMDESEQMLLVGVLYEIALSCAKPESDYKKSLQRKYIQSISQYLHIINLPRCPINAVKNVDSKKAERAILQCVMEYLYLESFSHSYIETHKTIMDCFDVGLETITTTQATIDEVVKAIGVEGLATRYGYAASEQIKARTPASLRIHIYYEPKVKHQPGNKDMAGKLKMALENCGNTCTLSPLSILSETALGINEYSVLLGENVTTTQYLSTGEYLEKLGCYGCSILVSPDGMRIILKDDPDITVPNKEEFIKYFEIACTSSSERFNSNNKAKIVVEKRRKKAQKRMDSKYKPGDVGGAVKDASDSICDFAEELERKLPFMRAAKPVLKSASHVTDFIGNALETSEKKVDALLQMAMESKFDKDFIKAAQETITYVKAVEYLQNEQLVKGE